MTQQVAVDIHDDRHFEHLFGKIDLVILKDAIEHIYDQEKFLTALHKFIKPRAPYFYLFRPGVIHLGDISRSLIRC